MGQWCGHLPIGWRSGHVCSPPAAGISHRASKGVYIAHGGMCPCHSFGQELRGPVERWGEAAVTEHVQNLFIFIYPERSITSVLSFAKSPETLIHSLTIRNLFPCWYKEAVCKRHQHRGVVPLIVSLVHLGNVIKSYVCTGWYNVRIRDTLDSY